MYQVVIVDDDVGFVETLGPHFAREGYAVVAEFTVPAAKRYLSSRTPDVLITDVRLGKSSGWELVQFVRQTQPEVPVIVVTGFQEAISEAEAVRLKVPVFLKPFDPDQLLDYVRHRLPTREAGLDPAPVLASLTNAVEVDFYAGMNEPSEYLMRTVYTRAPERLQVRRRQTELQLSLVSSTHRCRRVLAFAHPGRLAIFQEALDRHLLQTGWTLVESDTRY